MTIKKLKEMIANFPDDMRVYADNGSSLFEENSEFVCICYDNESGKAVLQIKDDLDVYEELTEALEYFSDNDWDECNAWTELSERGYNPEDFPDPEYARSQMENYGLI